MLQRRYSRHKLRLHAYGLLCALLAGCSSPSGNFDLGRADAQIGGLIGEYPEMRKQLEEIRGNIQKAELSLREKEKTIDTLSQTIAREQQKSETRLALIWKLTSGLLGILVVGGVYLAWKLR